MNTLRTLTIIFSLLILIPIGHGIVPLVVFEIPIVSDIFSGDFEFNISGSYYDRLTTAGLMSLIGQSILISCFFFDEKIKSTLSIIGCVTLLTATYLLTKDSIGMKLDMFLLTLSFPFVVTGLALVVLEVKDLRQKINS
jgi:hypothetical protein